MYYVAILRTIIWGEPEKLGKHCDDRTRSRRGRCRADAEPAEAPKPPGPMVGMPAVRPCAARDSDLRGCRVVSQLPDALVLR